MELSEQIKITKRLLAHIEAGTAESAGRQSRVKASDYIDRAVWKNEIENIHKRAPIVACLSGEIAEPGTYKSTTIVGVPIVITRDEGGELNAFLNSCMHRGAPIIEENGKGSAARFTCAYHGWTYDAQGRLIGVPNEDAFGEVDRDCFGLTRIPVAERAGLVFVGLTPGMAFDIDDWLAGLDKYISFYAENLSFQESRCVEGANWKLMIEGHLESYHFASLHRDSLAPFWVNNCATIDRFGPHILITFCTKRINELRDIPEEKWRPIQDNYISPQYFIFPNTMYVMFPNAVLAQVIQPNDVDSSTSTLAWSKRAPAPGETGANRGDLHDIEGLVALVRDEDYAATLRIQRTLAAEPGKQLIFGRNEPGLHYFHENIRNALR